MDNGTSKDFIEDLQQENHRLHQALGVMAGEMVLLEADLAQWRKKCQRIINAVERANNEL
jgi:hypothetical protein